MSDEAVTIMSVDIDVLCPCGILVSVYKIGEGMVGAECPRCGEKYEGTFSVTYVDKGEK